MSGLGIIPDTRRVWIRATKFGTARIPLLGEVVAVVAVVLAEVPREKNRQRFESLKELNAGGLLAYVAGAERGWG